MNSLEIRSAGSADLAPLVSLNALVQVQHAAAHPDLFLPPSAADLHAHFEGLLADSEFRVRLAVLDGSSVGYTVSRIEHRPPNVFRGAVETAVLHAICVATSVRGTGVGTALMSDFEAYATASGIGTLLLDTWAFNVDAQRFFERRGFSAQRIAMWRRVDRSAARP